MIRAFLILYPIIPDTEATVAPSAFLHFKKKQLKLREGKRKQHTLTEKIKKERDSLCQQVGQNDGGTIDTSSLANSSPGASFFSSSSSPSNSSSSMGSTSSSSSSSSSSSTDSSDSDKKSKKRRKKKKKHHHQSHKKKDKRKKKEKKKRQHGKQRARYPEEVIKRYRKVLKT
ncbi:uncharacterized G-patch domain protein DDB_G0278987-like [Chaetodon trifascialis]|uniref:uncharacterized G-patch domain protein DDB_G0278987-like n=1 Tax=Chaetodon trifascialis TaxID=109706 RepID=UPI0039955BA9